MFGRWRRPLRVLFVFDQYKRGGFETHLDTCLAALARRRVVLYTCGGPDFARSPARAHVRAHLEVQTSPADGRTLAAAARALAAFARAHQVHLVHAHPFAALLTGAAGAGLAGVPLVATFHGPSTAAAVPLYYPPALREAMGELVLPHAAARVAVSEACAQAIGAAFGSPAPMDVVPNPVLRWPRARSRPAQPPIALFASRLDGDKETPALGALELFGALRRQRSDWRLRVAGDGPLERRLAEEARARGLDVEWLGHRDDIAALLHDTTVALGLGRFALEALTVGRPAILVGCDGVVGLITPSTLDAGRARNFSGRGQAVQSAEAAAQELHAHLARGRHPARTLRRRVLREHDAPRVAAQLSAVYARAQAGPAPPLRRCEEIVTWLEGLGEALLAGEAGLDVSPLPAAQRL